MLTNLILMSLQESMFITLPFFRWEDQASDVHYEKWIWDLNVEVAAPEPVLLATTVQQHVPASTSPPDSSS